MGQYILLIAGGAMIFFVIVGFFRSFWTSRKRSHWPASAGDWDNSRLPEHTPGAGGGNPPEAGHGVGHH
jgi:hypothetical protein